METTSEQHGLHQAGTSPRLKGYVEKDGYDPLFVVDIQVIQRAFAIPVQASDLEFCG
jgi:hypothetical protein